MQSHKGARSLDVSLTGIWPSDTEVFSDEEIPPSHVTDGFLQENKHLENIGLSDCHTSSSNLHVRFEVFTAVTMNNGVFWDVTPFGSCNSRRFGGT
jgi:hypothetical protein